MSQVEAPAGADSAAGALSVQVRLPVWTAVVVAAVLLWGVGLGVMQAAQAQGPTARQVAIADTIRAQEKTGRLLREAGGNPGAPFRVGFYAGGANTPNSLNDDGLQLDPAQWQTTWFKGGSEPGVMTLTFLATTRSGHSYMVAVQAEDRSQPIDQAAVTPAILSAVRGALTLAARR